MSETKKKGINFKAIVEPTLVLTAITIVCVFLLGATYEVAAPIIAEREKEEEIQARIVVLPDAESFGETRNLKVEGTPSSIAEGFDAAGHTVGYVITGEGSGYGGVVRMLVGFSTDGVVTGAQPLVLNETAGLGMKAENPDFLAQFLGQEKLLTVVKSNPHANQIESLTGATITTGAVTTAVNRAMKVFEQEVLGEGDDPDMLMSSAVENIFPDHALSEAETYTIDGNELTASEIREADELVGYVVTSDAEGFGGPIQFLIVFDLDGTILEVEPVFMSESPEYGMKAAEDDYLAQYIGVSGPFELGSGDPADGKIDAVTGATGTSTTVLDLMNRAVELFHSELES